MRLWSSLVMTWASQAYNPGSNPGDRIFYASSQMHKNNKQEQIRGWLSEEEEEEEENTIVFHC